MAQARAQTTHSYRSEGAKQRFVVFASSLGTIFEWYDFYIYGTLASFFGALFFPKDNATAGFLASLAIFGAGFGVRPLGALVFGRLGDLIGRKYTFIVTIITMGASTAAVGLLPTYESIGIFAPLLLVALRLAQGLALGGEYGGAATYVAEHAPHDRRGYLTSWIQTTATLGLLLSLVVILLCRTQMSPADFSQWGWRIPFLISVLLLGFSVYIRLKLQETPIFQQMKREGRGSKAPLTESFLQWKNAKIVLLALLGATAGQGVVWYTGQFYALYFLGTTLHVDYVTTYLLIAVALLIGTPFFIFFGSLSDRIGRKKIMMAGCLLAAITYYPIFQGLTHYANPALEQALAAAPVNVSADKATCNFSPFAQSYATDCDKMRAYLTKNGISYGFTSTDSGQPVTIAIGGQTLSGYDEAKLKDALKSAGYPDKADPAQMNIAMLIVLLTILVIYVTMVYGPIAAYLVELFPTRIRYSSMSLPYHIGNGWFGGFLPFITFALAIWQGNIYAGLYYPVGIACMTFVIGSLLIRETKDHKLQT
ncbi:MAG TPA: MFS transporter [Dongiaceae bacterium]|jgi:MFS family permease|nr:MFS transporter [Dongiaceae bacterium]